MLLFSRAFSTLRPDCFWFCFFFFNDFIYFYFWLHWVSIAFLGLSPVAVSGDCFIVVCRLLIMVASLVEHRL